MNQYQDDDGNNRTGLNIYQSTIYTSNPPSLPPSQPSEASQSQDVR